MTKARIARTILALAVAAGLMLSLSASAFASAPSSITILAYSTGRSAATVEGVVNPDGAITHYEVDYGLVGSEWCTSHGASGSPEHTTAPEPLGHTEAGFYTVAVSLSGLSAGTSYCAEILAENATSTGHGGQVTFTAGTPTVVTLEAFSVSPTEVGLAGAVDAAGQTTQYKFELALAGSEWCASHGVSGSPESTSPMWELESKDGKFHVAAIGRGGLSGGTEYCYEVVAENATGTGHGGQVSFTAGAPTAETGSAVRIGPTTTTIEGEVAPAGQTTHYAVQYGLASSKWCETGGVSGLPESSTSSATLGSSNGEFHEVSVDLNRLTPSTEYCAELVAGNGSGTGHGGQVSFTTTAAPRAITLKALATGTTTATVEGEIDPEGQTAHYEVEYAPAYTEWCQTGGFSGTPEVSEQQAGFPFTDDVFHSVEVELKGLSAGTEYCADLVAVGSSSSDPGAQVRFTTTAVHKLTVSLNGTGSGTVSGVEISCPGSCAGSYEVGTHVALIAMPAAGSTFAGWGGSCAGSGACEVTLSADQYVTATFTAAVQKPSTIQSSEPPPTASPAVLPTPPSCSIATSSKSIELVRPKPEKGKRAKHTTGRFAVTVSCDQEATVKLSGLLTDTPARKGHGSKSHSRRLTLTTPATSVSGGRTKVLTLQIPTSAVRDLQSKAKESLALTLGASDAAGEVKATATIAPLKA